LSKRVKVGANDHCPCGSLLKYKKCCKGLVDWPLVLTQPLGIQIRHLSVRGKNLVFLNLLADALQLDSLGGNWADLKRAFSPEAVQKVFAAVEFVWPDRDDLNRALLKERGQTSGLYVGLYEPELILTGLTRHSLYADKILLVDPLMNPSNVRPKYNPLLHPEMHSTTALRAVFMWFALMPWIDAGIVSFIKTPGDLDTKLEFQAMDITKKRYATHPELEPRIEETASLRDLTERRLKRELFLGLPDHYLRTHYREFKPQATEQEVELFIKNIQNERDADPFFLDTLDRKSDGELNVVTTGASYEMAKITAALTGSFVMTDIPSRWREIALDRSEARIDPEQWSPFAKAFHGVTLKYLNSVPLPAALEIRQKGRLENLRAFLRRVWKASAANDQFDEVNVVDLAAELAHEVGEAESEWKSIDRDLIQWFGAELLAGALAAAPAIASGGGEWVGYGLAAGGITSLLVSGLKRSQYDKRYPAGFFVRLRSGEFAE